MEKEVLHLLTQQIHTRWLSTPKHVWIRDSATEDDIKAIEEAGQDSQFDPLRLRASLLDDLKKGQAYLLSRRLVNKQTGAIFAQVHLILPLSVKADQAIPWALWAQIFLLFGMPGSAAHRCRVGKGKPWRIILFGSLAKRQRPALGEANRVTITPTFGEANRVTITPTFGEANRVTITPTFGEAVGPAHVNGGYAYPGDPRSVVIYRLEEATRVLLHELLHACGSDDFELSEAIREVRTESFAELFLIAVLAKGVKRRAEQLWSLQAQWIRDQEEVLRVQHGVKGMDDYAWRYITGRRAYLETFGLHFPAPSTPLTQVVGVSTRFTHPSFLQ